MQKFVNQAISFTLLASAAFAHADVVPTNVQALTAGAPRTELSAQSSQGDGRGILVRSFPPGAGGRQDGASVTAPIGDRTSTKGMLLGALAIMGIVVRRRWNARG